MPTTIGSLTNVPNPGSPIASPWAQDVTRLGRHPFTSAAALLAQWPSATNGSQAILLDTGERVERRAGVWVYADPLVGRFVDALAGVASETISIAFGATFTAAPVVLITVEVGSNADLIGYLSGGPTTSGFTVRVSQRAGATLTLGYAIHWAAYGTRQVGAAATALPAGVAE